MKEKVIVVDADGVLLDWTYSFTQWMTRHGYPKVDVHTYDMAEVYNMPKVEIQKLIRIFNESAAIYNLPPLRDAIKYIRKLHEEHGYVFHVVSSLSNDYNAQHLRTKNLQNLFGITTFEKFIYLDTGADKDEVLRDNYGDTGCYFVEDKVENAECGVDCGLESILMIHTHNMGVETYESIHRVWDWKGIVNIITEL